MRVVFTLCAFLFEQRFVLSPLHCYLHLKYPGELVLKLTPEENCSSGILAFTSSSFFILFIPPSQFPFLTDCIAGYGQTWWRQGRSPGPQGLGDAVVMRANKCSLASPSFLEVT